MPAEYSNYLTHGRNEANHLPHDDQDNCNMDHVHGHHSHDFRHTNSKLLAWCLIITFSFSIVEGVGGYLTHSITLQTDALHMLTDAAGLLIAYVANIISKRPATISLTFGFGKAEAVGALMNCMFTLMLTLVLLFESIIRFWHPTTVDGIGLLIIATLGLVVNGGVATVLSHGLNSLNTRAAFIHALGDILGSIVAIIAGAIIYFTGFKTIDPILSIILICFLITSNYNIIKRSIIVLMAGVPEHLDYKQIGFDLENMVGIVSIHDLHVWYMSANRTALSAHIVAKDPLSWQQTLLECQQMLLTNHSIEHVTLQHEFDNAEHEHCELG